HTISYLTLSTYILILSSVHYFHFNESLSTELYPRSLHDALPIFASAAFFTNSCGIFLFSLNTLCGRVRPGRVFPVSSIKGARILLFHSIDLLLWMSLKLAFISRVISELVNSSPTLNSLVSKAMQ